MSEPQVLIVGAGPTGLVLGLWLARLGVPFRICEKNNGPGQTCDAAPARSADSTPSKKSIEITVAAEPESIPDGERKTVTALFADIKGSMELIEDLDPEEARIRRSGGTNGL